MSKCILVNYTNLLSEPLFLENQKCWSLKNDLYLISTPPPPLPCPGPIWLAAETHPIHHYSALHNSSQTDQNIAFSKLKCTPSPVVTNYIYVHTARTSNHYICNFLLNPHYFFNSIHHYSAHKLSPITTHVTRVPALLPSIFKELFSSRHENYFYESCWAYVG